MSTSQREWVPLTDEIMSVLHAKYYEWIDNVNEIRERMDALREETRTGWKAPPQIDDALTHVNKEDEWFAAKGMDTARGILATAEADAAASKPHRMARIEQLTERTRRLESAYTAGWRPGTDRAVKLFGAIQGSLRTHYLDDWESIVTALEASLPCFDFGGNILPARQPRHKKARRNHGRFN